MLRCGVVQLAGPAARLLHTRTTANTLQHFRTLGLTGSEGRAAVHQRYTGITRAKLVELTRYTELARLHGPETAEFTKIEAAYQQLETRFEEEKLREAVRGQQLQLGHITDRAVEDLIQESMARHGRHGAVQRRLATQC